MRANPCRPLRALFLLLATLLGGGFLAAQDDEAKLEALKEFRKYFPTYREVAQQREAVFALKGQETVDAAQELVRLLEHRVPEVREAVLEVLGTYSDPRTFAPFLAELPKEKNAARRANLVEVFARAKVKEALPLLRAFASDKNVDAATKHQVARALQVLGTSTDVDTREALAALLAHADPMVRVAAVDTTGSLRVKELGEALVPLLDDAAWQVQASAIQAVAKIRVQSAIDPLIAIMKKGGRLQQDAGVALERITALEFGFDTAAWEQQVAKLKSLGWRIPTDEELEKAAQAKAVSDKRYGRTPAPGAAQFAQIQTTSTQILFIIDISGSMEDLVVEREKFQGYDDYSKFAIVRTELLRAIDSLQPNSNFNIVAFATELHPWKKTLVPANVINKDAARSWVRRLKPLGGKESQELAQAGLTASANIGAGKTNTYTALLSAFGVDPDKAPSGPSTGGQSVAARNRLDTVYFLSDGRPSTGKLVDTGEILKAITELNRSYKMVIHTIAIGEFQKEFLKDLAAHNGGVFVDLGR